MKNVSLFLKRRLSALTWIINDTLEGFTDIYWDGGFSDEEDEMTFDSFVETIVARCIDSIFNDFDENEEDLFTKLDYEKHYDELSVFFKKTFDKKIKEYYYSMFD